SRRSHLRWNRQRAEPRSTETLVPRPGRFERLPLAARRQSSYLRPRFSLQPARGNSQRLGTDRRARLAGRRQAEIARRQLAFFAGTRNERHAEYSLGRRNRVTNRFYAAPALQRPLI